MSFETFEKDGLIYRKITEDDIPKILAFTDIFLRRDYLVRKPELIVKIKIGEMIGVFDKKKLIAWGSMGKNKRLWNLLVHPKYRGKKIGENIVMKLKPDYIRSKMDQSTGDPTKFYEKIGYKIIQEKIGRKKNINLMIKEDLLEKN